MKREIKFRIWIDGFGRFEYADIKTFKGCETLQTFREEKINQYTGLKDHNGKEIYEGDVVKFDDGRIAEVAWHTEYPAITVYPTEDLEGQEDMRMSWEESETNERFEVVGNIYQNPELLK